MPTVKRGMLGTDMVLLHQKLVELVNQFRGGFFKRHSVAPVAPFPSPAVLVQIFTLPQIFAVTPGRGGRG